MVWYVILIEAIVFAILFTTILFVSFHDDKMYSAACIHNYPPDIQEEYFNDIQIRGDQIGRIG